MKGNIFNVFQTKDSDDEGQAPKQQEPSKLTKKEARAEDQIKREAYGTTVDKEVPVKAKFHDGPRNKGDYRSGEKRPFERHSGTGKPAFAHDFKKGGHGKGNVGGQKDIEGELTQEKKQAKEGKEESKGQAEEKKEEPKEEIITLDQYVAHSHFNTDFLKKDEQVKAAPVKIDDKTVKVVPTRTKDVDTYSRNKVKSLEDNVHAKGTNVVLEAQEQGGSNGRGRPQGQNYAKGGKGAKIEFNEKNFPSLS